jgi:hypothetical protein
VLHPIKQGLKLLFYPGVGIGGELTELHAKAFQKVFWIIFLSGLIIAFAAAVEADIGVTSWQRIYSLRRAALIFVRENSRKSRR